MKRCVILLFVMLFIFIGMSHAFAQADKTGFEIRAGIALPYLAAAGVGLEGASVETKALKTMGVGLNLQAAYRWRYFGIGLEQLISGGFALEDTVSGKIDIQGSKEINAIAKGDGLFIGATYLILKQYIPFNSDMMLTIAEGAGVLYGAKMKNKKLFPNKSDSVPAFKLEVGFTYFLFSQHGLGLNIDFVGGLSFDNGISISKAITPILSYEMIF